MFTKCVLRYVDGIDELLIFSDFTVMIETFITALFSVEVIISLLGFPNTSLSTRQNKYRTEQGVNELRQCFDRTR
jgi:hypothetical protein